MEKMKIKGFGFDNGFGQRMNIQERYLKKKGFPDVPNVKERQLKG